MSSNQPICITGPPIFKDKTNGEWIARPEMSPVEIKCVACGKPKPTIKWFKDKQFIDPGVTGGRVGNNILFGFRI